MCLRLVCLELIIRSIGIMADKQIMRKVKVEGGNLKFSSAHFITFGGKCERLHGHNYGVLVEIEGALNEDRKSTRLNSSHQIISYAGFCLKKKMNVKLDV